MSSSDESSSYFTVSDDECAHGHAWLAEDEETSYCDNCGKTDYHPRPECDHHRFTYEYEDYDNKTGLYKTCIDCGDARLTAGDLCIYHKVVNSYLRKPQSSEFLVYQYPMSTECSCDHEKKGRCQNILRILTNLTLMDRCRFEIKFSEDKIKRKAKKIKVDAEIKFFKAELKRERLETRHVTEFLKLESEYLATIETN